MLGAPLLPFGAPTKRRILLPGARPTKKIRAPSHRGLVLWWPLGPTTISGTNAYDVSGLDNHGTITGGPTVTGPGPYGNRALTFDGSTKYVAKTLATGIPNKEADLSLSVRLKWPTLSDDRACFSLVGDDGPDSGVSVGLSVGPTQIIVPEWGNAVYLASATAPAVDVWHTITYVQSGIKNLLYIDGVLAASTTIDRVAGALTYVSFGDFNPAYSGSNYIGDVSDVRVYNRALSYDEVRNIHYGPSLDYTQPIDRVWANYAVLSGGGPAAGNASGTGTASAVGASSAAAAGNAAANGTATAVGASSAAAAGNAAANGTATAVGAALAAASGVAAGIGTAAAFGPGLSSASAAGIGTASAVGAATTMAVGASAGVGTASASGTGVSLPPGDATGTAAGIGTAAGVVAAFSAAVGRAAGAGDLSAIAVRVPPIRKSAGSRYQIIIQNDAPLWARQLQAQFNDVLARIQADIDRAKE